jgi:hypothetical protein
MSCTLCSSSCGCHVHFVPAAVDVMYTLFQQLWVSCSQVLTPTEQPSSTKSVRFMSLQLHLSVNVHFCGNTPKASATAHLKCAVRYGLQFAEFCQPNIMEYYEELLPAIVLTLRDPHKLVQQRYASQPAARPVLCSCCRTLHFAAAAMSCLRPYTWATGRVGYTSPPALSPTAE